MKLCNKIVAYDLESTSEQFFRALRLERETKLKNKIFSPCLYYLYRSRLQNVHVSINNYNNYLRIGRCIIAMEIALDFTSFRSMF